MFKRVVFTICVATLAACSQPMSESQAADPGGAVETSAAEADAVIAAWVNEQTGGDLIDGPTIFRGDFSGDGAADALVYYLTPLGGNNFSVNWALFRAEGGALTFLRMHEGVYGTEPRDVVFAPGQITLTTTMPREGDARCCPTGSQQWTIATN